MTLSAPQSLIEYADSRGRTLAVDAAQGIIRGVKVLGLESKNGRTYTQEAIRQAVGLYEGAKVNVNHPAGRADQPRDYRDRIGALRHVRAESDGLYADLHYNTKHPLAEQLAWDAQHAPENVGLSHNVEGKTITKGGRLFVETITKVTSVDLVADPATTRGLFEQDQGAPAVEITVEAVEANAQIMEALRAKVLAEHAESESSKAQAAELKRLKEEMDGLKAEQAATAVKAAVDKLITEARLPKEAVTEVFLQQLLGSDEAGRKRLIEDRQSIWRAAGAGRAGPKCKDQHLAEGAAAGDVPSDAKSFAALLRG